MPSLVPRLSRAPTRKIFIIIVDFVGPRSTYPVGIRAGQSNCTEDNFCTRDNQMSNRRVTAVLDPCSNLVKRGLQAYSRVNTKSNYVVSLAEPDSHTQQKKV